MRLGEFIEIIAAASDGGEIVWFVMQLPIAKT